MTNWTLLAMAGKRTKARKRRILGPIREIVEKEMVQGLQGVDFASSTAERLAQEADLSWRDFIGQKESNCAGFTAADVRLVIGSRVPPEEEAEDDDD